MHIPKHLRNLTNVQRAEIVENWTYLLIGARADLRLLSEHHGNRSYAEVQVQECEAKIAYFKSLPTVEDKAASRQRQREQAKKVMNRAHVIQKTATASWGDVFFSACLRAAWQEEKTGKAFQIVRESLTQIFFTLYKALKSVQVRSELLMHPLSLDPEIFVSWRQRGVISVQENEYVETARVEAASWEVFESGCLEWEKGLLREARIRAAIVATEEALRGRWRQHWPAEDLEEKLAGLRRALA